VSTLHLASVPQLANAWTIVRLSLHVLAASVWVGGQLVLAGLVVTLRGISHDAPGKVARAFARLSWPAFWLLVATGVWNYLALDHANATTSWKAVFGIKMISVVVAGLGAFLHTKVTSPTAKGVYAGVGTIGTVAALVLGVALSG
jgi:putative copper export protein